MSWYRLGTISLTKGSVDVVGVGTAFSSEVRFSDILLIGGALYEIARVESDTKLKLTTPFEGTTVSGSAYAIIRNLTNASNYDLMKKIEEFLTDRQRSMDEFVEWINGLPNSGPTSNGIFPLTDRYGVTVYCKSPKQMEADTLALTTRQSDLISQTETALASAESKLTALGNQEAWADQILGYKNAAAASATKAGQWAESPENTAVETGKYSAKHHAIKAAASATASANSASAAATSKTGADSAKTAADTAKTAAQLAETNAAGSAAAAKTSETNAAGSASAAATSASQAATSKTGADTAKTQAETARTGAQTSETNAAASATAAATSASNANASANTAKDWAEKTTGAVTGTQYSAKYHAQLAQTARSDVETRQSDVITRQTDVQSRQSDVITRQSNVVSLESSATSSKNAAATSATTAATKATEASNSATAASTSAANAVASEQKASKWAEEPENTAVETGKYSAKHHALKAAASATAASTSATNAATAKTAAETAKTAAETARTGAQTAETNAVSAKNAAEAARDRAELAASSLTGSLVEYGGIDLSGGAYPAAPASACFWKVTVGGTVGGIDYGVGDTLVYSKNLNQFYKIDNTESVTSVNGKTGALTLSHADVGALAASGTAVAAAKLSTARTISLTGDVTGSVAFDGSGNVSITATVANDSHTHDTRYPVLSAERVLTGVAAGSWVTIAQVPSQGGRAYGEFIVYDTDSGKHNAVKIIASHAYGQSVVACVGGNRFATRTIAHVRVLHGTADRTYDGAKLQVYIENTCALRVRALMINQINGWSAWSEMTPVVEGTPAGWAEDATTRYDDITSTATSFSGSFSGNGALLTGLNAANLASGTIPDARLSGTYTGVNITGNAATATKLATARSISLTGDVSGSVAFDGSGNVSITTVVADDSHNHIIGNVDGLQTALDGKLSTTGGTMTGALNGTRAVMTAAGNGYSYAGLETRGNGSANTVFPAVSLHQPGVYAGTLQLRGEGDFRLYGTNDTTYGSLTALQFNGSAAGLTSIPAAQLTGTVPDAVLPASITSSITGNAATATKLATARTINGIAFDGTANISITDPTSIAKAGDTITGKIAVGSTTSRSAGMYGTYDSTKIGHVWSMGTAYAIPDDGSTFGTLYGMAYKHTNNTTGGTMAGGHQIVFCSSGTPGSAIGLAGGIWTSGNVSAYSDIRVKTNIEVIPHALAKVMQLRGVTYDRIDRDGERQTGVIAQEVQKVLPEAVSGDDMLSVAYGNMVGLLIEAIKELNAKIDSLQEEVVELRRVA